MFLIGILSFNLSNGSTVGPMFFTHCSLLLLEFIVYLFGTYRNSSVISYFYFSVDFNCRYVFLKGSRLIENFPWNLKSA